MPAGRATVLKRFLSATALVCLVAPALAADAPPDYSTQVAPLLTKYCGGCHKTDEPEGKFSVATWKELQKGGEHGPAFLAGDSGSSRMIRLMTGAGDQKMPPEGEKQPTQAEIAIFKAWIDGGAKGPSGSEPDRPRLVVPSIASQVKQQPVTALAASPDGKWLAVAGFECVHLLQEGAKGLPDTPSVGTWRTVRTLKGLPGKVQSLHFSKDSQRLITSSGVTGLAGKAAIWNVADGKIINEFEGHRDTVYDAELSPNGKLLATCSYDRRAILWDAEAGEQLRVLEGHTGAIYDVAFSPDSTLVATASADDTCKIWLASTGERLDTLIQPLKEAYAVAFSPNGREVLSAGADNRVRVWQLISKKKPAVNPQIEARFAHEGAVLQMALTPDGSRLVTVADNKTIKVWETKRFTEVHLYEPQPSLPISLAVSGDGRAFFVGRLDGSLARYDIPRETPKPEAPAVAAVAAAEPMPMPSEMSKRAEQEPNNDPAAATRIEAPGIATGVVNATDTTPDVDCFRFTAKAGQTWVLEVKAARDKSPLDSQIEVLTADGERIPRVLLQSVKDSYFTFRGKNGTQADDFRIFNWEEMELNDLLYCNGEVVKLWHYPRGPDSGFMIYPGEGNRWGYYDTTGLAHALGEPCYIVRPHPPGTPLIPNGLPVFTIYYENDDDARRELGDDSRLTFTSPADGDYIVRLRDVRGQQGEKYTYSLTIRPPQPNFEVTLRDRKLSVSPGSGKEFRITARRDDGYEGPIDVVVSGLPEGLTATPVVIEAGQIEAFGLMSAAASLSELPKEIEKSIKLTATARINDRDVTQDVTGFTELKVGPAAKVLPRIVVNESGAKPVAAPENGPLEFEIEPGQTIMLKLVVERKGFDGVLPFGTADAGRNLPYGVYVDNIGLNGLLLLDGQTEREFFITASQVAAEQTRTFFVRTTADGAQATPPVILHVRRKNQVAMP
jgi:hypothetical protein